MIGVAMGVGKGLNRLAQRRHERLARGDQPRHYGRTALKLSGVGVGVGLLLANGHLHEEHVETAVEGGSAEVLHVDRKFSQINIISFDTRVDGIFSETGDKDRGAFLGIPLPDLTTNLTMNNLLVESSLCMPAKEKTVDYFPTENKYVVHIDPADISVCSKQDPLNIPEITPGGSWAQKINDASNDLNRIADEHGEAVKKENAARALIEHAAITKGIYDVNMECAPKVFDVVKEDFAKEVANQEWRKSNETIEVVYDVHDGGDVTISGKSDMDAAMAKLQADGVNIKGGLVSECKLPESETNSSVAKAQ
jgi:hypothetical protein